MEKFVKKHEYNFPMAKKIASLYRQGEEDETMRPIALFSRETNKPIGRFKNGDYVIFYDIRGEREVELTEALTNPQFPHFPIAPINLNFATMIEYDPSLNVRVAFSRSGPVQNTLSEVVSKAGLSQVKIVESEKAAHLSYFLNGKRMEEFPKEERIVIESPKVHEFDSIPAMNIEKVAEAVQERLKMNRYDLVITNFCNIDVVGHTENEPAIIKAIQAVDKNLDKVVTLANELGYRIIVTADHGTVERRYFPEGTVDTGHTDSKVPFIFIDLDCKQKDCLRDTGTESLTDVAPTILHLLGISKPPDMTGRSLLNGYQPDKKRPVLLIILDGWGYREEKEGNLIAKADPPVMKKLMNTYPWITLHAAGEYVGMPKGTVGNSEAGHLHIGAGRVVTSDRLKIDRAIENRSFFTNPAFKWAMEGAKRDNVNLHLLGIVSFYSSHGSIKHLFALMDMAKEFNIDNLYIHSMLGRRGERPESGALYIESIEEKCAKEKNSSVVSVIGRKWALDREHNWDRVEKAYRLFVYGEGEKVVV
jgi:2,3-bisphosphoglycerate-independent phosphoglycerate mutase